MKRHIATAIALAGAALCAAAPLHAGTSLNASGQTRGQVEDLGEIVEAEQDVVKSRFRANITARGEFTSNALLTGNNSNNDFIFLPVIELGYTQPLGTKFTLDLAAKVDLGLYVNHTERAFVGYSFKSTLDYQPVANSPKFFVAVEPYRYDSIDGDGMISQAIGFSAGTDWGYAFNEGHSLLFTGYAFTAYIADPDIDTRNAHKLVAGVSHQFRDDLTGQLFYAWQHTTFTHYDRADSKHLVGMNLIYQFAQDWFATLAGAFADNDSDKDIASYQSVSGSLGVTYQF
jgi:hypothetical protein